MISFLLFAEFAPFEFCTPRSGSEALGLTGPLLIARCWLLSVLSTLQPTIAWLSATQCMGTTFGSSDTGAFQPR